MSESGRMVMTGIGLLFAVLAAGAVLGAYPRSFRGEGGGEWVVAPGALMVAGVLAAVAAAHLWAGLSDGAAAGAFGQLLIVLGVSLAGLVVLPPAARRRTLRGVRLYLGGYAARREPRRRRPVARPSDSSPQATSLIRCRGERHTSTSSNAWSGSFATTPSCDAD
jgi:hypothetical protein